MKQLLILSSLIGLIGCAGGSGSSFLMDDNQTSPTSPLDKMILNQNYRTDCQNLSGRSFRVLITKTNSSPNTLAIEVDTYDVANCESAMNNEIIQTKRNIVVINSISESQSVHTLMGTLQSATLAVWQPAYATTVDSVGMCGYSNWSLNLGTFINIAGSSCESKNIGSIDSYLMAFSSDGQTISYENLVFQ